MSQIGVLPKGFQGQIGGRSWPSQAVMNDSRHSSSRRIDSPSLVPILEVKNVFAVFAQADAVRSKATIPVRTSRKIIFARPVRIAPSQRGPSRGFRFAKKRAQLIR